MTSSSDFIEDDATRFLLSQGVGDTEDVENYRPRGFHPVHLGDRFDGGRYRVVHKLGAGGFSTVWLARDESDKTWVALKIVESEHSTSTSEKSVLSRSTLRDSSAQCVAQYRRSFTLDGPNGRHLCLVLPVLGQSASELSHGLSCRLKPWLARRLAYQATNAVADLHSQGLCHGGVLETESGIAPGLEAPRYIVKNMDFLSSAVNLVKPDIKLVDFDQCSNIASPPPKLLGTPIDFLAPQVAVGLAAGPASDVWALGCCIFRLRSGEGPFSNPFDASSPADLMSYIIRTLGQDIPRKWQDSLLWDHQGQPTKDSSQGKPHEQWWDGDGRSLRDLVYNIWDEPKDSIVQTRTPKPGRKGRGHEHKPFASHFSNMVWNPRAVKVDDIYLSGYNDDWSTLLEALPKIPEQEAILLCDLLSKVFVYDPASRLTAREMLDHPWLHIDGSNHAI